MSNPLNIEAPPATGGDQWKNADHEGELIVLTVKSVGEHEFENGLAEFVVCDITVVEGPSAGETYDEAWVLGKVLFGQLKRKIGRTFVGRIGKGAKVGSKSAPWQLDPVSAEDTARAVAFMTERLTPPAAGTAAAAPAAPAPTEVGGDDVPPWERK